MYIILWGICWNSKLICSGGFLHGVNNLTYGVDIQQIRWMGILQVTFFSSIFTISRYFFFKKIIWFDGSFFSLFLPFSTENSNCIFPGSPVWDMAKGQWLCEFRNCTAEKVSITAVRFFFFSNFVSSIWSFNIHFLIAFNRGEN